MYIFSFLNGVGSGMGGGGGLHLKERICSPGGANSFL